jgi:hypothetical protein
MPHSDSAFVSFMNTFDNCTLTVGYHGDFHPKTVEVPANYSLMNNKLLEKDELFRVPLGDNISWTIEYSGSECEGKGLPSSVEFPLSKETASSIILFKINQFISPIFRSTLWLLARPGLS